MRMKVGDLVLVKPEGDFKGGEFIIGSIIPANNLYNYPDKKTRYNVTRYTIRKQNGEEFSGYLDMDTDTIRVIIKEDVIRNISQEMEKNIELIKAL